MSAPTIKTWVTGELVSAADLNGQIKEQLANSFLHKATEAGSIPYLSASREEAALAPPADTRLHYLVNDKDNALPQWTPHGLRYTELGTYTSGGDTDLTTWSDYLWLYVHDNGTRSGHWILVSKITDNINTSARVVYTDLGTLYHYITLYKKGNALSISARRQTVNRNGGALSLPMSYGNNPRVESSVNITIYGVQ